MTNRLTLRVNLFRRIFDNNYVIITHNRNSVLLSIKQKKKKKKNKNSRKEIEHSLLTIKNNFIWKAQTLLKLYFVPTQYLYHHTTPHIYFFVLIIHYVINKASQGISVKNVYTTKQKTTCKRKNEEKEIGF